MHLISMAASEVEYVPTWGLPGKLSGALRVTYSARSNILIYGSSRDDFSDGYNQCLHEVISKVSLHNDCTRKLVNESHGVFVSLNNMAKNLQENRSQEVARISQKYRAIILACLEDLSNAIDKTDDEDLIEQRDMFSKIELVWHLLQLLIIDVHSGSRVLYKLLEWIQWHSFSAELKMKEIVKSEDPYMHLEFWDTIIQFQLQGKMQRARSLLAMHKNSQREDFVSLDELFKKMPMYTPDHEMSLNEFKRRWQIWQDECKARLQEGEFALDSGLETACKILCGDNDVLSEKSYLCSNWYHLMISVLLFTNPCISLSALSETAAAYYSNVDNGQELSVVDTIILAAMELDIINVIQYSCSFNDGWWFVAHMADLLSHGNYVDLKSYPKCNREYLLTNYAEALFAHSSLWQVGISYLDYCQEIGREMLELYLERIPLDTEAKARKILHLARQRNLENLARTVCNVMTARAMANGKLGSALSWIRYSKDVRFANELASRWMKEYTKSNRTECLEILDNMGSCMLVSDKLTFVGKYCEFHKLYRQGEQKPAASLLVSLISSGLAPVTFQIVMLLDALPLLENSELIFSTEETFQLMSCLEDIVKLTMKKKVPLEKDKESLIRLALVRNLARSLVIENADPTPQDMEMLNM